MTTDSEQVGSFRILGELERKGPGRLVWARGENERSALVAVVPAMLAENAKSASEKGPVLLDIGALESGEVYFAYDVPFGESLSVRLRKGPMGWSTATLAFLPVIRTLLSFHTRKEAYGPISPSQMIVGRDGTVALIGRELSWVRRVFDRRQEERAWYLPEVTPYMSPETARGDSATPASDIFSLGTVLFEVVTGHRVFDAPNTLSVIHQIQTGNVPDLRDLDSEVPVALAYAVGRALDKEPSRRPGVMDILEAFAAARGNGRVSTPASPRAVTPTPQPRRLSPPESPAMHAAPAAKITPPPKPVVPYGAPVFGQPITAPSTVPDGTPAPESAQPAPIPAIISPIPATVVRKSNGIHYDSTTIPPTAVTPNESASVPWVVAPRAESPKEVPVSQQAEVRPEPLAAVPPPPPVRPQVEARPQAAAPVLPQPQVRPQVEVRSPAVAQVPPQPPVRPQAEARRQAAVPPQPQGLRQASVVASVPSDAARAEAERLAQVAALFAATDPFAEEDPFLEAIPKREFVSDPTKDRMRNWLTAGIAGGLSLLFLVITIAMGGSAVAGYSRAVALHGQKGTAFSNRQFLNLPAAQPAAAIPLSDDSLEPRHTEVVDAPVIGLPTRTTRTTVRHAPSSAGVFDSRRHSKTSRAPAQPRTQASRPAEPVNPKPEPVSQHDGLKEAF
jgi:serine/threonine protein kinase